MLGIGVNFMKNAIFGRW